MYSGYVIEEANVDSLYNNPHHPYTLGLLGSLPHLNSKERKRLFSIEGLPPTLLEKPVYCPFQARCKYKIERCENENPILRNTAPSHKVACWVDITTGREMG
jgi:oligopeptide transport system ATP-binding protein